MIGTRTRRLLAVVSCVPLLFLCGSHMTASGAIADTQQKLQEAQEELEATEEEKEDKEEDIDNMESAQSSLMSELSDLTEELEAVSENLEEIENRIIAKNEEIETTQAELEEARETEEWQYICLKKRIQYTYEQSSVMYLEAFLSSGSLSEMLNLAEYFSQVAAYDQEMLESLEQTRITIEEKEAELEADMAELEEMQAEAEAEQENFSALISQTQSSISSYSSQIATAEAEVEALEAEMEAQNENISALQQQLAEEIAKSQLAASSSWRDISEVTFSDGDRYLLANLIYCEAGGEPYEGQVAVGAVVINRVLSSVYPNTVSGVIYQSGQFEPVSTGRLALALAEDRATSSCYQAADAAMSGVTNVGTCVYFRTPIEGLTGITIGGHVFY